MGEDYRDTEDILNEMPRVCKEIGLKKVPDFTTMKKAFDRLSRKVFVVLLYLTVGMFTLSGGCAIDSTGMDRRHASNTT